MIVKALVESLSWLLTHFFKNGGQWAKASEGRLKKVEANKGGKEKPVRVMINTQGNANKNKQACDGQYNAIYTHIQTPLV
jgi:hypothetical protein